MTSFAPDARLPVTILPSPNHGPRRGGIAPDMIVLHYTGMASAEAALARLTTEGTDVSSHYLVYEDGRIVQSVAESERAWHAGAGSWQGADDINSRSIGIEIVNPGHEYGYRDFPRVQIDAVIALCRDIAERRAIRADRVVAHSDIAPERKQDPGERFPWDALAAAGVGLWVSPAPEGMPGETLALGSTGDAVRALQRSLAQHGYRLDASGVYDAATTAVVTAFQRHFRPSKVDGVADMSTVETLHRLHLARKTIELCDFAATYSRNNDS